MIQDNVIPKTKTNLYTYIHTSACNTINLLKEQKLVDKASSAGAGVHHDSSAAKRLLIVMGPFS